VFLFNFAQFVDWPAKAFADRGPVGDRNFGDDSLRPVPGRAGAGKKSGAADPRCDVSPASRRLRVPTSSSSTHPRPGDWTNHPALPERSLLTVRMRRLFARGGIVRFVTENGKIRMRINVEAARASGLTISSKSGGGHDCDAEKG